MSTATTAMDINIRAILLLVYVRIREKRRVLVSTFCIGYYYYESACLC